MADTLTANYKWVQPEVGAAAATWGASLNANLAAIDTQVYANQQAGVPIGSIIMFGGATAPANWWVCDGRSISTTTYAALFAAIGYAYGGSGANFNLPNFLGVFPTGTSSSYPPGQKGGASSQTITVANLPPHAHGISDPGHVHGVAQTAHAHGVTDPQHTHTVTDPQHSHGYTHIVAGSGPYGAGTLAASGSATTNPAATGVSIASAATGVTVQPQNANIAINSAATGVTTTNTGGGTPLPTEPPWLRVTFCIRYQ